MNTLPESALKAKNTALLPLGPLLTGLGDRTRWGILSELSLGEPMMVKSIAKRLGCSASAVSKHMAVLRASGAVVSGEGGLYRIPAAFLPMPGQRLVDFGHCLLRFDAASAGA